MIRKWKKYVLQNRAEGDCQLVTTVNAYHYLTGRTITPKRYERFVKETGAYCGSCIGIEKVWKQLGIMEGTRYYSFWEPFLKHDYAKFPLPLEFSIWHKFFGFHSVMAVEYEPRTKALRVPNMRHVTSHQGWIFAEDLHHYAINNPNDRDEPWQCRTFILRRKRCKST